MHEVECCGAGPAVSSLGLGQRPSNNEYTVIGGHHGYGAMLEADEHLMRDRADE
jgi:hypothetical protein